VTVLALRTAYWLVAEFGNLLAWIGVGGTRLADWAKRKREAVPR
jgi:hypothetical protein